MAEQNAQSALRVAVVVLNWNGWRDTVECLESVLRSDYPNYRVVVCDNGSTDDSVANIRAWADGNRQVEMDGPPWTSLPKLPSRK